MAELERDHSAADKHHLSRQSALAQHIVGGDHHLGAGKGELARLRAGGDYDVLCLQDLAVYCDRVRAGEAAAIMDHFDAALFHQFPKRGRDLADHRLLAVDQRRPVEARLADRDMMRFGTLDLIERVRSRDQHLFRHAAAVWARPAEQVWLNHGDFEPRLPRRHGNAHTGIAAANDHYVKAVCGHPAVLLEG